MTRPAQHAQQTGDCIVALESRLNGLLNAQVPDHRFVRTLRTTQREWSHAIWAAAEKIGPTSRSSSEVERGLQLAKRPIFICGAARSGTSLLRDLLDGHPELAVIPNESSFYTARERSLMGVKPDLHSCHLGCWWLERFTDPPPFWLLGRSMPDQSPYIEFARDFAGWWQLPERHVEARIASWPLAAFALAYAQWLGRGDLPSGARAWVEKTPGSERCLSRIWHDFPAAKVIQIVRRPEAVLASIKRMTPWRWSRGRTLAHILGLMAPSYRAAAFGVRHLPEDRYCLVRYEDLAADPASEMTRIARFLEIEPTPSLFKPTLAGRPAFNNTSFGTARPAFHEVLDPVDRAMLALAVSRQAAKLGYATVELGVAAEHPIVGKAP